MGYGTEGQEDPAPAGQLSSSPNPPQHRNCILPSEYDERPAAHGPERYQELEKSLQEEATDGARGV